jgi:thymidine kinase
MSLNCICGPMFSGKSEELVRRVKRCLISERKCVVFKHSIDSRYHESDVVTHAGISINAFPVSSVEQMRQIIRQKSCTDVFFDEVQFMNDTSFIGFITELVDSGINVTVAGLDTTFKGEAFPGLMGELLCLSDSVVKLKAICLDCKEDACRSKLINERSEGSEGGERSESVVNVGGMDKYKPVCRKHFS